MSMTAAAAPLSRPGFTSLRGPAVVAAIALAAAYLHLNWAITSDTSWLITACERMLGGAKLYSEIAEPNPPMSLWLYMPWVWLAPRIGLTPETLIVLATIGTCLACIAVAQRILSDAALIESAERWYVVAAFALILMPMMHFTQRDQFAVALALPMLAAYAVRADGRALRLPWSVAAGLCGGLVMAIKPHFALGFLVPALFVAATRRSWRPLLATENVIAAVAVALYADAVVAFHPEFLSDMLPVATAIYVPNRMDWPELLTRQSVMLAGFCLLVWLIRDGLPRGTLARVLLAGAAGFFGAYLVQGRGFEYHMTPALTLIVIGLGLSLTSPVPAEGPLLRKLAGSGAALFAACWIALGSTVVVMNRSNDEIAFMYPLQAKLAPLGPGLKLAALSSHIMLAHPLHRLIGAESINRGPMLWIAGNAYKLCSGDVSPERRRDCDDGIARERTMLREDLERTRPDVVLVSRGKRDWLAWAREDSGTAALLDGYRSFTTLKGEGYDIDVLLSPERWRDAPPPVVEPAEKPAP